MPDATIPAPQKSETEPNDETPERERQLIHLLSHYAPTSMSKPNSASSSHSTTAHLPTAQLPTMRKAELVPLWTRGG